MNTMIRITQHAVNTRAILYHPRHVLLSVSHISRCPPSYKYIDPRERAPCPPPPPPPPPPPRDYRLLWGAMAAFVLAGGFAVYAKTSPEIRDWLTINAAWFDDVIAVMYQENMTYKEFASQCIDDARTYLNKYLRDDTPKQCSYEGGPIKADLELPDQPRNEDSDDEESPCDTLPPPVVTRDVCEMERCLSELGDEALNNYNTAIDACNYYNKLVEEIMQDFSMSSVEELRAAMLERQDLVNTSVDNATSAVTRLDDLSRYFECGVQAPKEALDNTRAKFDSYRDRISRALTRYQWENDKALAIDRQLKMVSELVEKYTSETQHMFPRVPQGDTDLLLLHANRYMQKLSCELQEARAAMTDRVNRGIDTLPQGVKEKSARDTLIQEAVRRRRTEMDRDFRKRSEQLRVSNEKMISESLKKQREKHEKVLQQRLQQKEQEATAKLKKLVSEKVAAEKKVFSTQLNEMRTKLGEVENKLNSTVLAITDK